MEIIYTLPIIKEKVEDVLKLISEQKNQYSYFEIWLDYLEDISTEIISQLVSLDSGKLIFLFRRQKLEEPKMTLEKRLALLEYLANNDVLIDLDMNTQNEELEKVKQLKITDKLILSYHNYHSTPEQSELEAIIEEMKTCNPRIIKVATFCHTEHDSLRLMQLLLQLKEKQQACIILGMGENGLITRVFGTLWGNEMIFAPLKPKSESAPNQLTRNQLEVIFKELGV